ncbi:enoyl-CoA hydratase/isomerase family protein [Christensenellaceae bacterium OttesenSCG-928-K19]|nr:enoyl-CoA hydratase/isomerase family protein [Christensenellaceae bacterium OttesenSCG-928-K19]
MSELVLYEKKESIALLTVNRPKALNAINRDVLLALEEAMAELRQDADIKAVILTGAGEKAFVAGADIAFMQGLSPADGEAFSRLGHRVLDAIENLNKIVIAAVNGFALGGGLELALACDIRVGAEKAQMGIPEVALGLIPGFGGTQRLPRLVGPGMAKEMLATGKRIKAQEALSCGLLNHVVPQEQLMQFCMDMAGQIAANSATAIAYGKCSMNAGMEMDLARALAFEAGQFGLTLSTPDAAEGVSAFLEKRPPKFQ